MYLFKYSMNLWTFGDSFAHYTPYNIWMKQVALAADTTLHCYGEGGTSLDYTYEQFNKNRHNIQENDILIFALTDTSRRWFLRGDLKDIIWRTSRTKTDEDTAIENYMKYLDNEQVHSTHFINFMYNLHYFTQSKNIHTILLPCFDSTLNWILTNKNKFPLFHIADTSLMTISQNEFEDHNFLYYYTSTIQGDLRRCHFIESNHTVLATKLIDNITKKKPLTLKQGFVEGVLNKTTLTDTEFSKQELFDVHLIPEQEYWNRTSLL